MAFFKKKNKDLKRGRDIKARNGLFLKKFKKNKKVKSIEEQKKRRRRIFKTCIATAGASFIFFVFISFFYFGYHFIITTPLFSLESIEINKIQKVSRETVLELAGLTPTVNILSLNLKEVETKILQNPWVLKVEIYRILPHKLKVQIEEKKILSVLKKGKELYYIDLRGEMIKKVASEEGLNYPVITSSASGEEEMQYFEKALWLLKNTSQSFYLNASKISEIHLQESKGLMVVSLPHSTRIKLGIDDFVKKLTRLEKVCEDLQKRNIIASEIDLNFKKNVVVKVRKRS
ncbi:MAG: FtsQ-type POTRA domain-containing protein [Deltaproteobacteria bacterium]|nr:FtsQ-type POTRA domain-containing protein [Deltaproteobacteria bacterium]